MYVCRNPKRLKDRMYVCKRESQKIKKKQQLIYTAISFYSATGKQKLVFYSKRIRFSKDSVKVPSASKDTYDFNNFAGIKTRVVINP